MTNANQCRTDIPVCPSVTPHSDRHHDTKPTEGLFACLPVAQPNLCHNSILARLRRSLYIVHCTLYILFFAACSPQQNFPNPEIENFQIRLISLAPSLSEIIAELDATSLLIARTDVCNYPAVITNLPSVGAFGNPDLERLLALRPTHVLYVDLQNKTLPELLRRHNIHVQHIPCDRLDDIAPAIRTIAQLTGHTTDTNLATRIETRIAELRANAAARSDAQRPGVFFFLWNAPLMSVGRDSFITELLLLAGGRNIADDVSAPYFNASPEWAIARNPDILISLLPSPPGTLRPLLAPNPGWSATRAFQNNRIVENLPLDIICRPGPRVLDAIDALQNAIRPESP